MIHEWSPVWCILNAFKLCNFSVYLFKFLKKLHFATHKYYISICLSQHEVGVKMLIKEHAFYSSNGCCIISQMVRACILVTRNVNAHVCVQVLVYNVVMKLGIFSFCCFFYAYYDVCMFFLAFNVSSRFLRMPNIFANAQNIELFMSIFIEGITLNNILEHIKQTTFFYLTTVVLEDFYKFKFILACMYWTTPLCANMTMSMCLTRQAYLILMPPSSNNNTSPVNLLMPYFVLLITTTFTVCLALDKLLGNLEFLYERRWQKGWY
jgi:hypothetical protein